jgi:hypothetical protein
MIFVGLLIANIFLNMVLTAYNLYLMVSHDHYELYFDYIPNTIISHEIKDNKYVIWGVSAIVIIITLFFIFPVLLLFYVHLKNFCQNRTTNERFGGKKYGKPATTADSSEQSSDYSATTSLLAEEIVKEIGEPTDYSDRKFACLYNCADMWCSKKIPN